MAKEVWLSTMYEGYKPIHLKIMGISEPFVYQKTSQVGRHSSEVGTTVRVYLKDEFLLGASKEINLLEAVREFCRHVQWLRIINDNTKEAIVDDWNTSKALVINVLKVPYKFELHLGLSNSNI